MTAKEFMTMQSFITKFQDRWVAGATGFQDIQDAFRHLQWREARRRLAEIAEKYDLDEYGLPRRGTW